MNTIKFLPLLTTFLVFVTFQQPAQAASGMCQDVMIDIPSITGCAKAKWEFEKAKLNLQIDRLKYAQNTKIDEQGASGDLKRLNTSQQAWERYIEATCDYEASLTERSFWRDAEYYECLGYYTHQRHDELGLWIEQIYNDNTANFEPRYSFD